MIGMKCPECGGYNIITLEENMCHITDEGECIFMCSYCSCKWREVYRQIKDVHILQHGDGVA